MKRDTRDGIVRLIEANPRYSVTSDAATYAGVELGWLHYLDLIGENVTPVAPLSLNFRHIVLSRDFGCIGQYRRAGLLTWSALLKSYRPPVAFFDFDVRDWRVTHERTALSRLSFLLSEEAGCLNEGNEAAQFHGVDITCYTDPCIVRNQL